MPVKAAIILHLEHKLVTVMVQPRKENLPGVLQQCMVESAYLGFNRDTGVQALTFKSNLGPEDDFPSGISSSTKRKSYFTALLKAFHGFGRSRIWQDSMPIGTSVP